MVTVLTSENETGSLNSNLRGCLLGKKKCHESALKAVEMGLNISF